MDLEHGAWVRVPVGEGSTPYVSVPFTRTVLVVARTVTTTVWLLDFLEEVFGDDSRVQLLFAVEDEAPSVYHEAARVLLKDVGVPVLPWAQACATNFDLAVCSTQNGSLEHLRSPLFITPHGPGFGKPASVRPGGAVPVPVREGWRDQSVPATTVVLSHPEQAALFTGAPDGVRLLVAGDPAYDRLSASAPRRSRYRRAFDLKLGQRLVVCSSTWGPGAQLGAIPDLAVRLAGELPVDEYRIAMIIHPNIWFGHGPWQVRAWLRAAREAGVVLVPPRGDEWRAAILACDLVVADHGSVGFYAVAIGRPLLRASFAEQYLRSDAPLAKIAQIAPELSLNRALRSQLEEAIDEHDPAHYRDLVDRMFAQPGESVRIMRDAIYQMIGLDPQGPSPRVLAVTDPHIDMPPVGSHIVTGDVTYDGSDQIAVTVRRVPAGLDAAQGGRVTATAGFGGGGGGVDTWSLMRRTCMSGGGRVPRSSRATRTISIRLAAMGRMRRGRVVSFRSCLDAGSRRPSMTLVGRRWSSPATAAGSPWHGSHPVTEGLSRPRRRCSLRRSTCLMWSGAWTGKASCRLRSASAISPQ